MKLSFWIVLADLSSGGLDKVPDSYKNPLVEDAQLIRVIRR
jgi:hypothetical protein